MAEKEKKNQESDNDSDEQEENIEEIISTDPTEDSETEKKESKFKAKDEKVGIAYIASSGNNTMVHITDLAGNTISRVSGGMITKHSRLKSNPTIAMFVAKRAAERPRDLGFTKLYIRMKGKTGQNHGPGANSAIKSLNKEGFDIISILDTTKVPRGGPKVKGGRRGRRV
jgi:small subunit ribosomal protein S11